jgi:ankyrin repeat protein
LGIALINQGATNNYFDEGGMTTLHWACFYGKAKGSMKFWSTFFSYLLLKYTPGAPFFDANGASSKKNVKKCQLNARKFSRNSPQIRNT